MPSGDNYFSALNSAVFTEGSFVFVPKGIKCPMELSTYFRINATETGQFERTLIICLEGAYVSYLEGCTAPAYNSNQLHAAVVELYAGRKAEIKYSTVQNWYSGDKKGNGGIYNFVTKRGLCDGNFSKISWTQVETGSAITWKYPSVVLKGHNTTGEFYSVALTNNKQQADTGSKMIHIGKNSNSRIVSKGISAGNALNCYRGLVQINTTAIYSRITLNVIVCLLEIALEQTLILTLMYVNHLLVLSMRLRLPKSARNSYYTFNKEESTLKWLSA